MKYQKFTQEERPFNMAIALLERCHFLLIRAQESAVEKNVLTWKECIKALLREIIFKLSDEEIEKVRNILKKANTNTTGAETYLDEAHITLVRLMYNYDLYYPKYEAKDWKDEAKEEDK